MDIADVIAMLIAIAAIGYSIVSTVLAILNPDRYKKRPEPVDEEENEEEDEFEEFEEDDDDEEDEVKPRAAPVPPPPPPAPVKSVVHKELPPQERFTGHKFDFDTNMDHFRQKTTIEGRALTIGLRAPDELVSDAVRLAPKSTEPGLQVESTKKQAPIRLLLNALPSKKLLWIAHEVIDKPLAFRTKPFPWDR